MATEADDKMLTDYVKSLTVSDDGGKSLTVSDDGGESYCVCVWVMMVESQVSGKRDSCLSAFISLSYWVHIVWSIFLNKFT